MSDAELLTAAEFSTRKFDLPDGGRWSELVAGRIVSLQPPDPEHGTVVLNLSKALADHLQQQTPGSSGDACFELGLIVSRDPDTVRVPALCYFGSERRFSHSDDVVTANPPDLVVEIPSTNAQRGEMGRRIEEYLALGICVVWVVDLLKKQVHAFQSEGPTRQFAGDQRLVGEPVLGGFSMRVADLFAEPDWWRR
jgi:Uma2 family endonuclease